MSNLLEAYIQRLNVGSQAFTNKEAELEELKDRDHKRLLAKEPN